MILDLVVDYLTYVFIPAYALIYAPLLPSPWGLIAALFIALTGVVYFADVRMKAEDNCFVGFPAVWQMPLLVLLTFDPPAWVTGGIDPPARARAVHLAQVHPPGAHDALAAGEPVDLRRLGGASAPGRSGTISTRRRW